MDYSKGICWLDDTRIPFVDEEDGYTDDEWKNLYGGNRKDSNTNIGNEVKNIVRDLLPKAPQGRFTPNLLVCDDVLNDGKKPNKGHRSKTKTTGFGDYGGGKSEYKGIGDYMTVDTKSRYYDIDIWFNKMIYGL